MPTTTPFPDTDPGALPQMFHLQAFAGVNTRAERPAIGDTEFSWLENYFPLDPGNMRTLWSNSTPIFVAPAGVTIIYKYFFNLTAIPLCAVFLSDGTAIQVNITTGAQTVISAVVGDFWAGGYLPAASQWTDSGIIIVTEASVNGYFAWDGTRLFRPGTAAPNWLTNSTPTTMPSGLHGNAIETYQSRVWVTTPPPHPLSQIPSIISQSAPANGALFGTGGGGSTPQQDASLRSTYTAVKQANGFLYAFGDSSVNVIGNVQTSGNLTTYTNQNVDPQIGTAWPNTVQAMTGLSQYGAAIVFANPQGVFVLIGGTVQKVSDNLDGLFQTLDTNFVPTAAVAIIFNVKVYCLMMRSVDYLGNTRNFMCMWDGKKWFIGSQDHFNQFPLAYHSIATQELNSAITAWGSDDTHLFAMFTTPSTTLQKTLQSKLWAGGQQNEMYLFYKKVYRFYYLGHDNGESGFTLTGTVDTELTSTALNLAATPGFFNFTNAAGGVIRFFSVSGPISFGVAAIQLGGTNQPGYGRLIGFTLVSTAPTMAVFNFVNSTAGVIQFNGAGLITGWSGAITGALNADYTLLALTMPFTLDAPYLG